MIFAEHPIRKHQISVPFADVCDLQRVPLWKKMVGNPADITVVRPDEEWTIDKKKFLSKGRNTPFEGWKVRGRVKVTICDGEIVYTDKRRQTS